MLNLLIALFAGVAVTVGIKLAHFPLIAALLPGAIAFIATFMLLARRVAQKVQLLMADVQKDLSGMTANPKDRQLRVDRAVKTLEQGLVYDRWQFLVGSELHAQIGMLKYMMKDLDGAAPHLAKANARNYMALALQGALAYQKKDYPKMRSSFEAATTSGRKEAVVWAAYAWCLTQLKDKDGALKVMARAVDSNPNDEKLRSGLTALQNDKRMKMRPYEPMWWQFGLEAPPVDLGGGRQVRFQRR